jgi:cytochrome c oxidase subunit I
MSNDVILQGPNVAHTHEGHTGHHGHEHHEQHFIWKYIFSQDHKIIARQFLVTGIIWAVIGALMSVFFRLQLGFPDKSFPMNSTTRW